MCVFLVGQDCETRAANWILLYSLQQKVTRVNALVLGFGNVLWRFLDGENVDDVLCQPRLPLRYTNITSIFRLYAVDKLVCAPTRAGYLFLVFIAVCLGEWLPNQSCMCHDVCAQSRPQTDRSSAEQLVGSITWRSSPKSTPLSPKALFDIRSG